MLRYISHHRVVQATALLYAAFCAVMATNAWSDTDPRPQPLFHRVAQTESTIMVDVAVSQIGRRSYGFVYAHADGGWKLPRNETVLMGGGLALPVSANLNPKTADARLHNLGVNLWVRKVSDKRGQSRMKVVHEVGTESIVPATLAEGVGYQLGTVQGYGTYFSWNFGYGLALHFRQTILDIRTSIGFGYKAAQSNFCCAGDFAPSQLRFSSTHMNGISGVTYGVHYTADSAQATLAYLRKLGANQISIGVSPLVMFDYNSTRRFAIPIVFTYARSRSP